jgi:hypothetical protein
LQEDDGIRPIRVVRFFFILPTVFLPNRPQKRMEEGGMGGRMDDMIRGGVTLPQLTLPQVASLCAEPDRECDDQSPYLSSQNADLLRGLSRRLGNAKSSTIKYLTGRDSNGKFVPAVELRSRTKVLSKAKQMVRLWRGNFTTHLIDLICIIFLLNIF